MPGGAPSDQLSRTPRGPTARPFHKQERPAAAGQAGKAPGTAPPCGAALPQWLRRPPRPRVAAVGRRDGAEQRAWRRSTALRPSAWRRLSCALTPDVGQPLLRDNPVFGSQTFTRDADPRLFKQGGAAGQQPAARARCMVAQDIERGAAPREPIASAIPVREGQREAQAPAQGDVHVRRGQRGARVSRHSRKPSPRMRARLRAETSAVARPHVWQKLGLAKID